MLLSMPTMIPYYLPTYLALINNKYVCQNLVELLSYQLAYLVTLTVTVCGAIK